MSKKPNSPDDPGPAARIAISAGFAETAARERLGGRGKDLEQGLRAVAGANHAPTGAARCARRLRIDPDPHGLAAGGRKLK